jgi:putative ABC transport system permease protein
MLRQPALRRIGLRNFSRRKWNAVLVIVGSMVGTALISGSLVLNDSTGRFQETEARERLGEIDEVVRLSGQRLPGDRRPAPLFGEEVTESISPANIRENADNPGDADVDGVLPVLVEELPVQVVGEEEATPAATVIGAGWRELGEFGSSPPGVSSRPAPGEGEAYVSTGLAESLGVETGDTLAVGGRSGEREVKAAAVVPERGISGYRAQFSSSDGTMLVSEADARALFEADEGEANAMFVSNEGDVISGLEGSGAVAGALREILVDSGQEDAQFQVTESKQETIEQGGFQIGDIFLMISSFAILAGILLIVNIYVMLAEERKGELGILRAVALKRSGLVRVFTYEGFAYSLIASIVGAVAGLGIAALLVQGINRAGSNFEDLLGQDLSIPFYFDPATPFIAASAGLLITFLAVFGTSLRVSGLNIVAAIRDLPEERPRRRRGRLLLQTTLLVAGLAVSVSGFYAQSGYAMLVGPVLAAVGLGFLISPPLPPRPVWSVVGGGVLAYAYFANELEAVARANETEPAMFFISGVCMVIGAVVLVTFNLGVIYSGLGILSRIVPPLAPILRIAVAHPASRRARTGFTLAMFALVVYVVTLSAVFSETQSQASESQRDAQLSGYDGGVQSGPLGQIGNFGEQVRNDSTLDAAVAGWTRISATLVTLPEYEAEDYQTEFGPSTGQPAPGAGVSEYLTFVSDDFLRNTTDELSSRAPRFETDRAAWRALAENPDLVMLTFPYDGSGDFHARPELGAGDEITLKDPIAGEETTKTVAGRIESPPSGFSLDVINGVIASEAVADEFAGSTAQETYLLRLSEGGTLDGTSDALEAQFADEGAQTFLVDDLLGRGQAFLDTFIRIVQAFLAFGLIVGVAGLAVISARSVHERRRDIGTLRAVGFKRRTVGWQFVVENSLVSLVGLVIGMAVGALGGYNLFEFVIDDPGVEYIFPWGQMAFIGAGIWVASLVATIVPAFRASRVPPVEALRYQG